MRAAIFFMTLAVVAWVGLTSPTATRYKYDIRPNPAVKSHPRRYSVVQSVKGLEPAPHAAPPLSQLERNVRKGEYVCGDKICKLQPGVEPKGCNGVCQYRV